MVQVLVDAGAHVDDADDKGKTVLVRASLTDNLAMVKSVLTAGADIQARDLSGRTALMFAVHDGTLPMVQLFLAIAGYARSTFVYHTGMPPK